MLPMYWLNFCDLTNDDAPPQWTSLPVFRVEGRLIEENLPRFVDLPLEDEPEPEPEPELPQASPIDEEVDDLLNEIFDEELTAEGLPFAEVIETDTDRMYLSIQHSRVLPAGMLENGDDIYVLEEASASLLKKRKYEEQLEYEEVREMATSTTEDFDEAEQAVFNYFSE